MGNPKQLKYKQESNVVRINRNIKAKEVRLIDPEGRQIGILSTHQALIKSSEFSMDLVEISSNTNPPVCKIMDYGRFRYERAKKNQKAKKKQTNFQLKEVKFRPETGDNDLKTKIEYVKKFIRKKNKVKVSVIFRGRENELRELLKRAQNILRFIVNSVDDVSFVEQAPKFEGRIMVMVLAPK